MSHRRNRHFNPKNAGAAVAIDSRFLLLNDNNAVSSWPDRLGGARNNDFSQGTVALQPTYKTNAMNGLPVVRFNADSMSTASSFGTNNSLSGNPAMTALSVHVKTTITGGSIYGWGDVFNALSACGIYDNYTSFNQLAFAGANGANFTTLEANVNAITCWKKPAGAINLTNRFRNGVNMNTGVSSSNTPNINGGQGLAIGQWAGYTTDSRLIGDIAILAIFASQLSDALQKRVQFYSAFSFKIACS